MKRRFVGCDVGFHVGKSGQPDNACLCVINDLSSFCRECRVSTTEDSPGDLSSLRSARDELE